MQTAMAETRTHRFAVHVCYEDTDAAGIVYHAQYLCFAERARSAFLTDLGWRQGELHRRQGILFPVRRLSVDYLRAVKLEERLDIHTRLVRLSAVRLTFSQDIMRRGDCVCRLSAEVAAVDTEARPKRLDGDLKTALQSWLSRPEKNETRA